MFLIESASPIRIPVLYRMRTIAGIAIRQEEGTFSLSRNESHTVSKFPHAYRYVVYNHFQTIGVLVEYNNHGLSTRDT